MVLGHFLVLLLFYINMCMYLHLYIYSFCVVYIINIRISLNMKHSIIIKIIQNMNGHFSVSVKSEFSGDHYPVKKLQLEMENVIAAITKCSLLYTMHFTGIPEFANNSSTHSQNFPPISQASMKVSVQYSRSQAFPVQTLKNAVATLQGMDSFKCSR